ncbi:TetR/AcrR family transcriptional regulator [Arthrobacter agilis]|uniref:TetR/AcrR family transcriptional regulator n=1 Tax=Arthrobacter agilis TaxID=37921 RepID=UPI00278997B5|nr:TetR/AcrR family transcriptional regulator [Arthrobacter agilis]MDQ0734472.1 AcrR family transcriptional regulator [Arthrobacter agilis]
MPGDSRDDEASGNLWSRPLRGARGPAPLYSRESIAATGIRIADDEGLEGLTMRAIARSLGTSAPSLYRYVTSREEILDLMVDAAIGTPPVVEPGPAWTEAMIALATAQLLHHRTHAWLISASLDVRNFGPNTLAWFESYLLAMEEVEAPARAKLELIGLVTGLVSLFAQQGRQTARATPAFDLLSAERHPHLTAALVEPGGSPAPETLFDRAVLAVCRGLVSTSREP